MHEVNNEVTVSKDRVSTDVTFPCVPIAASMMNPVAICFLICVTLVNCAEVIQTATSAAVLGSELSTCTWNLTNDDHLPASCEMGNSGETKILQTSYSFLLPS